MKLLIKIILGFFILIFICVVLAYLMGYRMFRMESNASMYPTFGKGDLFIVSTKTDPENLETGDIITISEDFLSTTYPLTKRVFGTPGDQISIKNDSLYIDYLYYEESFVYYDKSKASEPANGSWVIQKDQLFVMGDNRNNSLDYGV